MLKINSNLRYATNAITCAILREIASRADVPLQVMNTVEPLKIYIPAISYFSAQVISHFPIILV